MRHSALGLVVALAIGVTCTGCKRHKPPALERVWLGRSHGCALEKNAGLSCWGKNDNGQLGDGTKQDRRFATRVIDRERPTALAIGSAHTCGLFGAGTVRCWGGAPGKDLPSAGFTAIAAAGDLTCALHPEGARCWSTSSYRSGEVEADWLKSARIIAGGAQFMCAALDLPRVVRCTGGGEWQPREYLWGTTGQPLPQQRPDLLAGHDVVSLATGLGHACAALGDGSVMCWGENDEGQLGDGTKTLAKVPVQVVGLSGAASVHAGWRHTCARMKNGTVACWGDNRRYQLANGTTESRSAPGAMFGLTGVQEVALGGDSSCVRLTDGMVKCWGANDVGQLGDGSTFDNSVPMPIRWTSADGAKR